MDKKEKTQVKEQTKSELELAKEAAELAEFKSKERIAEANARAAEANADKAENEAKNSKKSVGGKIFEGTCKVLAIAGPLVIGGGSVLVALCSHQNEIFRASDTNKEIEKSGLNLLFNSVKTNIKGMF